MIDIPEEDSAAILTVNNISKKFCRGLKRSLIYGIKDIATEISASRRAEVKLRKGEFWALDNISFRIAKGDAIGLVGANGSGKTTLLRIISGLIKPDHGRVSVRGRIVPLIALGAGFNQILTGRENIYVNLAILGMTATEINNVFNDVVNFAEIGDALDAPVQSYSSGMAARLGFACAVHANADILLIDEVLSVGDMRFRNKCYRKLAELRGRGASFILVSHNTNAILSICNKAVYLSKGKEILTGNPAEVMTKYEEDLCFLPTSSNQSGRLTLPVKSKSETTGLDIIGVYITDKMKRPSDHMVSGDLASIVIKVFAHLNQEAVIVSALIRELSGELEPVLHLSSDKNGKFFNFSSGEGGLEMSFPVCGLGPGLYSAKIHLHKKPFHVFDAVESLIFKVSSDMKMSQCLFFQPVDWLEDQSKHIDSPHKSNQNNI